MRWGRRAAVLPLFLRAVAGQNSTTSGSAGTSSVASTTSSAGGSVSTDTSSANQTLYISMPVLFACQDVQFIFQGPPLKKTVGLFAQGSSQWLEVITLDPVYDSLTSGTFSWRCDFPAGLTVAAMIWYFEGSTQVSQTTQYGTVQSGTDRSCFGANAGADQGAIVSAASSLDPLYTFTAGAQTSGTARPTSAGSSGGGSNTGPIVGGVVGGVIGLIIAAIVIWWCFYRRPSRDGYGEGSVYSEKVGSMHHRPPPYRTGSLMVGSPPPTSVMGGQSYEMDNQSMLQRKPANMAYGSLPEPMDAASASAPLSVPHNEADHASLLQNSSAAGGDAATTVADDTMSMSAVSEAFTPMRERERAVPLGSEGLDDPNTFLTPHKPNFRDSEHELDDPGSFSPARGRF